MEVQKTLHIANYSSLSNIVFTYYNLPLVKLFFFFWPAATLLNQLLLLKGLIKKGIRHLKVALCVLYQLRRY